MNLQIGNQERGLLLDLVETRIGELHPEIRRSMHHEYRDKLKTELDRCRELLERLKALEGNQ